MLLKYVISKAKNSFLSEKVDEKLNSKSFAGPMLIMEVCPILNMEICPILFMEVFCIQIIKSNVDAMHPI